MMSIGEFALNTGLSVKALRFYDERGVLAPAAVDTRSGYRSYSVHQLRDATTIRVLRAAGVSLDRVTEALTGPDRVDAVVADRRREVTEQRGREDRALALAGRLDLLRGSTEVATRDAPAQHWVAVEVDVDVTAEVEWEDEKADEGFLALASALVEVGNRPSGPFWTTMRPGPSADAVTLLLSWPVEHPADPTLRLDGWTVRTGTLPARTEAYVTQTTGGMGDEDLLDGDPGGRLPAPEYIALLEFLADKGVDASEVRQVAVLGADGNPVAMEAVVTIEER